MLQLALCQELDAVTASRQYCVVFIGTGMTSHFQVRRKVCQRRRSIRHIYESPVSPWRMSVVAYDCGPRHLAVFYTCLEFRPLLDSGVDLQCGTVATIFSGV